MVSHIIYVHANSVRKLIWTWPQKAGKAGVWTMDWLIHEEFAYKKIQRCLEAGHFSQDGYEQSVESSSVLHGAVLT